MFLVVNSHIIFLCFVINIYTYIMLFVSLKVNKKRLKNNKTEG